MAASFNGSTEYDHIGMPVTAQRKWDGCVEAAKVHYTDPQADPYRIEYLLFAADSPLPKVLQTQMHVAFQVPDLAAAMAGCEVVVEPFCPFPDRPRKCAFILHEGVLLELIED